MSYVPPPELARAMVDTGQSKVLTSTRDTLIRAFMGGAILALGAAFAITVTVQTGSALLGALLFPAGFVVLYLLGFDLLTGVFTMVPMAYLDRRPGVTLKGMFRTWGLVFVGNFVGAFTIAVMITFVITYGYSIPPDEVGQRLGEIGEARTLGYAEHGAAGMATLFLRGVLCNWMVSTGVIAAMMSKNVTGKVVAMWMPVMLFFYMGFEHSVVNMFLFPSGLLLGGDFSLSDYLVWNEIPTVLGNMVGGIVFVGLALYITHVRTGPKREVPTSTAENVPADV
ncbi:MAG: formate/nitrite transporter family protein [Rhodococcus sp.]|uniref:formate/nitrite transporter family protein n=1 Tax=Rhodococcus TaxID=1827 RepID=UPI0016A2CA89|nr:MULTISPECIES: formate/nitrite transporter family protein [Rhodococcus]NLV80955.1 formate/nitrite transporter family protein [Rhodococcus sp. (in: high G+C Gram-positive bacteria)]